MTAVSDPACALCVAVTREKQTEVINAKNRFETDLKTQAEETRRVMEEMRAAHKEQMARMQSEMEAQMHAMRREHSKVVDNYEARDQAWQLEKEVIVVIWKFEEQGELPLIY